MLSLLTDRKVLIGGGIVLGLEGIAWGIAKIIMKVRSKKEDTVSETTTTEENTNSVKSA